MKTLDIHFLEGVNIKYKIVIQPKLWKKQKNVYPVEKGYLRQDQQHSSALIVTKSLVDVEVAENKVFPIPVHHVISQDHK